VFGFREWRFGAHAKYPAMPENGSLATIPRDLAFEVTNEAIARGTVN
jgi:hypothetical protein